MGKRNVEITLAKAMLALTQLVTWRRAWVVDWKPDWTTNIDLKWCIVFRGGEITVDFFAYLASPLSFPTEEMANEFLNTYYHLFEQVKPLFV